MTDWIKHNGGPQPVADDVWVEFAPFTGGQAEVLRTGFDRNLWRNKLFFRILNQHLIDAARLEGIRLGLEAAVKAADAYDDLAAMSVQRLDPETIAREAADKETAR